MNHHSLLRQAVSLKALAWAALAAPLLITACASGGGGAASPPVQSLPPPPLPPAPPPPPPPPPPPAVPPSAFETQEYNTTRGLPLIGASTAFAAGASGQGIIVGVIDTGADQTHPDLAGQFTGPTFDVRADSRAQGDVDGEGHGTLVSGIIAARRDGSGIMGVAFNAKVLDVRADRPGSCAEDEGCKLQVSDIIDGINHAIENGAKIINLSLGSSPTANTSFEQAILDAAARGVLIVIAAGNDAEPAGVDENGNPIPAKGTSPNSPARAAGFAGSMGRIIAVGSVIARDDPTTPENEIGQISAFSNRAGPDAKFNYILAPGEGVVTTGPDGTGDGVGDFFRVAGTSFAAPYIAGSLALLLEHFPNLQATPETAIQILLDTADDYINHNPDLILGIPAGVGPDDVSGVGILNLARAFAPQGPVGVIVNQEFVPLGALTGSATGAFGDWATHNGLYRGAAMIDRYDRAFSFDPVHLERVAPASLSSLSQRAAAMAGPRHAVRAGAVDFAWSAPRPEYNPSAPFQEEPAAIFSTTIRFQGGEVTAGRGGAMPRLAPDTALAYEPGSAHALSLSGSWGAVSHEAGPVSLHAFAASDTDYSRFGAGFGDAGPHGAFRISVEHIRHDRTALGGGVQSRLGGEDSSRLTALSLEGSLETRAGWHLSGGFEAGLADIGPLGAAAIPTTRWSAGLSRPAGPGTLAMIIAQPRRAEGGGLSIETVTGATPQGLVHETRRIGLAPSGRQLNLEARYSLTLAEGWSAEGAAALLHQPGHARQAGEAGALWIGLRGAW